MPSRDDSLTARPGAQRWLFAYFRGERRGGESVWFARNREDALDWEALSDQRPALTSTIGTQGVRDPFLLRAEGLPADSARFYLIATDLRIGEGGEQAWRRSVERGSRGILVWRSDDLRTWRGPELVDVAPADAGNAWAPEAVFDEMVGMYRVYWASTVGPFARNEMWFSHTSDFRDFTEPARWGGGSEEIIDATAVREGDGVWWRFAKDERDEVDGKYVIAESAASLDGPWRRRATGIGRGAAASPGLDHAEGPIVFQSGDRWMLFLDEYGRRGYQAFESPQLNGPWTLVPGASLPTGARHGSILEISQQEWEALVT